MMTIRKAADRGHANHGWLDTYHTFSFASYYDPKHMGFRSLRVINDDTVAPGHGFGSHPHRDMEILTYVLEGQLAHRDSTGEKRTFGANTIQTMSAGSGIVHSEFNASAVEPVHFLQIWIEPSAEDVKPEYQQISMEPRERHGKWRLLASPERRADAAHIHQDAKVYAAMVEPEQTLDYPIAPGRHAWVHVAQGEVEVNGQQLQTGDGVALSEEAAVRVTGLGEVLLFDLA